MKFPTLVKDWLTEFKTEKDGHSQFYIKFFGNSLFYQKVLKCLEHKLEVESICHQIYNMGLSKIPKLNLLLLDMLPSILSFYLSISTHTDKNRRPIDETMLILRSCLMSVRDILISRYFSEQADLLEIPGFNEGSIYHCSVVRPDLDVVTQSICRDRRCVKERSDVRLVLDLLRVYNGHVSLVSRASLEAFCGLAVRVASVQGVPRVLVDSGVLVELCVGAHAALFNAELAQEATAVLAAVEARAALELSPEALLMVSAVQHARLLECAVAPHGRSVSVGDSLITNATFRPEKVAEDIDVSDIAVVLPTTVAKGTKHAKANIKFTVSEPPLTAMNND